MTIIIEIKLDKENKLLNYENKIVTVVIFQKSCYLVKLAKQL